MVICVEVVSADSAKVFTDFLAAGGYENRSRSEGRKQFYRFEKPKDAAFPFMIELFSRKPDQFTLADDVHTVPIPVEDALISLSAVLIDDAYFGALKTNRRPTPHQCGFPFFRRILRRGGKLLLSCGCGISVKVVPARQMLQARLICPWRSIRRISRAVYTRPRKIAEERGIRAKLASIRSRQRAPRARASAYASRRSSGRS